MSTDSIPNDSVPTTDIPATDAPTTTVVVVTGPPPTTWPCYGCDTPPVIGTVVVDFSVPKSAVVPSYVPLTPLPSVTVAYQPYQPYLPQTGGAEALMGFTASALIICGVLVLAARRPRR